VLEMGIEGLNYGIGVKILLGVFNFCYAGSV
jgi:hypothetical protein